MTHLNTGTDLQVSTETAIGLIPCYNQPFIRNQKGQFIKILTDEERKKRANENSKKWAKENRERRKEIEKKSRAKPEVKKRNAELKLKRYYEGLDVETRKKYAKSDKGKIASDKAKKKWKQNNPEKIKAKDLRHRSELNDCYLVQKIRRNTNLTAEIIRENPELIEIKRLIIKTKRLCKTSKNLE